MRSEVGFHRFAAVWAVDDRTIFPPGIASKLVEGGFEKLHTTVAVRAFACHVAHESASCVPADISGGEFADAAPRKGKLTFNLRCIWRDEPMLWLLGISAAAE